MADALAHVSRFEFYPRTVIDVGVAEGTFPLYKAFPNAFHLLIEPLQEFEPTLRKILETYKGGYIIAAANSQPGCLPFNVHTDHLVGSSFFNEAMGPDFDGTQRMVNAVRIDDVLRENRIQGPYLIKVDTQGSELNVLEGALKTLEETELIILEVSMFQFMVGAPQFHDVVIYMKNRGFVAYDIFGGTTRPLDVALGQIDMVFVKENGLFRRNHCYATPDQWKNR